MYKNNSQDIFILTKKLQNYQNEINKNEVNKSEMLKTKQNPNNYKSIDLTSDINSYIDNFLSQRNPEKKKNTLIDDIKRPENINNTISKNLKTVELFRKTGSLYDGRIQQTLREKNKPKSQSKKRNYTPSKLSIQEKQRFKDAFFLELSKYFGSRKIVIPELCSCGNLQKKINLLIRHRNFDIMTCEDYECANNCIYYQKPSEYHRALTNIIQCNKIISGNSDAISYVRSN